MRWPFSTSRVWQPAFEHVFSTNAFPSPAGAAAVIETPALSRLAAAIAFVDRVAEVAEQANHHPDILLHGWNKVRLTLSTHSQGGLTEADFRLAAQFDQLD